MTGERRGAHHAGYTPRHLAPAPRRRARGATARSLTAAAALAVVATAVVTLDRDERSATPLEQGAVQRAGLDTPLVICERTSVADRAALALVVGLPGVTDADHPLVDRLAELGPGGVMLRDGNLVDLDQAEDLVRGLRERLGEHLLVAVDEEGGRVTSLRGVGDRTPSARRLGRRGPDDAADAAAELADLLRSLDIDWIFAPVVDLDDGPAGGVIGDRSYGADPALVAETASAFAGELRDAGIAVTAKHFPGHGGEGDPHHGVTVDPSPRATLVRDDLVPFDALIDDGADAVMVGHVSYPQVWGPLPASLEPGAYELLRSRGFEGVAVTDALGMGAVHASWGFDVAPAMALAAGADVALVNQGDRIDELVVGIVAAVERGDLPEDRLDEAVGRVLRLRGQDPTGVVCPTSDPAAR